MNSETSVKPLTQPTNLWVLFASTLVITALFPVAASYWGVTFIDSISQPDQVRATISAMTDTQRSAHAWLTVTLDVAYPLAYGAFFAGSALAFFPKLGRYLAIPAYVVIPTDLAEGIVQVLALLDVADLVVLKSVLTPLKTALFLVGFGITVFGWCIWIANKVRSTS